MSYKKCCLRSQISDLRYTPLKFAKMSADCPDTAENGRFHFAHCKVKPKLHSDGKMRNTYEK